MKVSLMLVAVFAVLTLCLPLVAVGSLPAQTVSTPSRAPASSQEEQQALPSGTETDEPPESPKAERKELGEAVETVDRFRILDQTTGKVATVSREDYVRGAVCSEMPPNFHTQALVAQAVAANTYALRCHLQQEQNPDPALKGADFSADPSNWKGYVTEDQARERFGDQFDAYWGKLSAAADEGGGYVLLYEEEPIVAAYHSISSGQTEYASNVWTGEAPYLVPAESEGDLLAPNYESVERFSTQEAKELLQAADPEVKLGQDPSKWLRVVSRSESGYVLEVLAGGHSFTGQEIRTIFGLRSSDFELESGDDGFTFTVRGYGHGVGLSQYGADYMARQGATFEEILEHYYTGCELRPVKD